MEFIANFIARFREPSSWAGIGVLLATFGVDLGDELLDAIALVGAGLAAGLSFFLTEKAETTETVETVETPVTPTAE